MQNEHKMETEARNEPEQPAVPELGQLGASPVGPIGIVLVTAYLILFSILLVYGVVQLWPPETAAGEGAASTSSSVTLLFWTFSVLNEVRLILIVALAGALGSLVHALRSFSWYIGHRELVWSWVVRYILLPFIGSTLGLIFFFVIRGGFFSPEATVEQTSPFGFAALAGLVGLFSEQAVLKLKEVAETLLSEPQPGADAKPQEKGKGESATDA